MTQDPVYSIGEFRSADTHGEFYANSLSEHLKTHLFVRRQHRHDFYLVVLITGGTGTHEIDFVKYTAKKNTIFLMQPGQMHHWKFSADISGFVFFHTRSFYEQPGVHFNLQNFDFYRSPRSKPLLQLIDKTAKQVKYHMQLLVKEFAREKTFRAAMLWAHLHILYLLIARSYKGKGSKSNSRYLSILNEFEALIEEHYIENLSAEDYAKKLHITTKHLNRVCRESIGKTSTQVIADRITLEAKRLLLSGDMSVSDVSYELNFSDISYFSRFFKKHTHLSPTDFQEKFSSV
jgi:AraC family transcriptional regulator, transcriptional activator of pobA